MTRRRSLAASAALAGAAILCFLASPAASFASPAVVSEVSYMQVVEFQDSSCNGDPVSRKSIATKKCISTGIDQSVIVVCAEDLICFTQGEDGAAVSKGADYSWQTIADYAGSARVGAELRAECL